MDISAKTDYAVRALLMLAEAQRDGVARVSAEMLAERQDLPRKFLEAILSDLRRAGLVVSVRGAAGGYRLATLTPVDQFAWSTHVEVVGVFKR